MYTSQSQGIQRLLSGGRGSGTRPSSHGWRTQLGMGLSTVRDGPQDPEAAQGGGELQTSQPADLGTGQGLPQPRGSGPGGWAVASSSTCCPGASSLPHGSRGCSTVLQWSLWAVGAPCRGSPM